MSEHDADYVRWLQDLARSWEIIAHRASDGARSASKGAERLKRKVGRLRDEVKILTGRIERLQHENGEQTKKISRLSLELLSRLEKSGGPNAEA
jgi:hypothetical protein